MLEQGKSTAADSNIFGGDDCYPVSQGSVQENKPKFSLEGNEFKLEAVCQRNLASSDGLDLF